MAFQLSPGVLVTEKDLTNIIPAVATSTGAFAGAFAWGPVMDPVTVSSENQLVQRFGKPVDGNARSFFSAANFLAYSNNLMVTRVDATNAANAVSIQSGTVSSITVTAGGSGYTNSTTISISAPSVPNGVQATATPVISAGVIISVVIDNPGSGYTVAPSVSAIDTTGTGAVLGGSVTVGGIKINNETDYLTNYAGGAGFVGQWAAKYPGSLGNSLTVSVADSGSFATWAYKSNFDAAPGTSDFVNQVAGADDELHVIVIDTLGMWTGVKGAVLEKYAFVSKASDARLADGTTNYYVNVVNSQSKYIWWMDHPDAAMGGAGAWGQSAQGVTYTTLNSALTNVLTGGADDYEVSDGAIINGFALYLQSEQYDVSLLFAGDASTTVAAAVINVAETRKDAVAFVSPRNTTTSEPIIGSTSDSVDAINTYRNALTSSSYGVIDTGFKYQYDRYNDVYRWVPLNGDIAGLCARTDFTNDPWWSPGGLNRGQIKNVVRLAVNPDQTMRDNLYKNGVNPVVTFPGQGTVLYGDKTMLAKPSAFDRINVRRLFIVLEKAIATAAKFQLFEFNDAFTRAQFRSMVEPFLRNVQGRRGVTDFKVVCDNTNNTGEVIDGNQFVADIYVKPARSINFITLNFVAARTGISFQEIGA